MILLGLGSNLGDRKANLEAALAALGQGDAAPLHLLRVSSVYESAALLPDNAPPEWDIPFYNIVAAAESTLPPHQLLQVVKQIEQRLGREDMGRWGPRIIDIDILACGNTVLQSAELTIPHAAMLNRDFVMVPLAEIQPHWCYPSEAGNAPTAHEVVQQKAMTLGDGLMRTEVYLQWRAG